MMIDKDKVYNYEQLIEIFDKVQAEVVLSPFGDSQDEADKRFNSKEQVVNMLMATMITGTMKRKLFDMEDK